MMIDAIATRRTTLNGKQYQKGDKVSMPLQQFTDFEPTGLFERAPATRAKAEAPAKKAKAGSTAATAKIVEPAASAVGGTAE